MSSIRLLVRKVKFIYADVFDVDNSLTNVEEHNIDTNRNKLVDFFVIYVMLKT